MAFFFICVDAVNEAVYELVAEPVQEPQAEEQQEDAVEHAPEDLINPRWPARQAPEHNP